MEKEALIKEFKIILIRSTFLNIAAYLISVIFIGFTLPMAVGLLIGTFGMLLNLFLLNRFIRNAVKNGGKGSSKIMLGGYIVRMVIVAFCIALPMLWCTSCMIGAAIPYIYPNLVYGGKSLFRKGGKAE